MRTEVSKSKQRFERDSLSAVGFSSAQRASTDALNVLEVWRGKSSGRSFDISLDEDERIEATLTFESNDEAARDDLSMLCIKYGISRIAI